ncbi:FHA domain-containing protein, partial [bacterium]|nr:FHA domain-containing protein [bacterium]
MPMLKAELVVLEGHLRGTTFPLGARAVIGRAIGCDIQLVHDGISRRHCEVTVREDGGATVEDLGSTNGTLLNGERITTAPLYHGDKLEVGPVLLQLQCLGARNPQDTGAELAPDLQPGAEPVALSASRVIPLLAPVGEPTGVTPEPATATYERTLASFFDIANFLVERRDPVALASGLIARLRRALSPDRAVLFDYDAATDRIQAAQVQRGKADPPGSTVPVPEAVVTKCLREEKVILAMVEDVDGPRSVLCAPLRVDQRTLGAIYLDRAVKTRRAYTENDVSALASAAGIAAYAIDRLHFEREARARSLELERQVATLEAQRDAYRAAFGESLCSIVAIDDDGVVLAASPSALAILEEARKVSAPPLNELAGPVLREGKPRHRARWTEGESPIEV